MGEYQPFQTLLEVSNCAKEITLGEFRLREEDMTEEGQSLIRSFNCFWETQVYSLQTQLCYFLTNLFRAQQYTLEQLGFGVGLAVCRKIKDAKTKVDI